ncbi:Hypothetical predicted protein [Paramuricea clavata]|uniref:Uncharacterized protein n=1 Tax=Paramuricea clavata TaxID=317549 RepID=A0A6S7GK02_PARCT|nr:Hypothetical predicted protein [Paramuricea clavata]
MNVKETRISLLHGVSFNAKGKLVWLGTFQHLQQFVEDVLNLSNGVWDGPGGHDKRFKSEKIDLRWYPDTKSITLSGTLKEEIKAKLESLASVSKSLANAEDHNKIADDHNEKEVHTNDEYKPTDKDHDLSLEAFKNQLQVLSKQVNENESALKIILNERAEKQNWADDQKLVSELAGLREENNTLKNENLRLKNENNDLNERINREKGKTKTAEEERDSMITAMRLLVVAESNTVIDKSQLPKHNPETEQSGPNGADECTTRAQMKDALKPSIQISNNRPTTSNTDIGNNEAEEPEIDSQ